MKEKAAVCQNSTVYNIQLSLTPLSITDKHRQTLSRTIMMEVIFSRPLYHVQFVTKNHSNNCLIIRTSLCYGQLSWPQNYQIPTISSSIVRISLLRSKQLFLFRPWVVFVIRTFDGIVAKLQDFNRETSNTRSPGRYALVPFFPPLPPSPPYPWESLLAGYYLVWLGALDLSSLGAIYDVTRNIKTVTKQFQKENIYFFPGNMIKSWKNERPQEREIYDRQRSSSKRSSCESCEIMAKARTKKHCLWSATPLLALHDQFTNIGFLLVVHSQLKCFGRILTRDFKSNTLIAVLRR